MDAATVFNEDPADQARAFAAAGFEWLHVVDLDGAFAGKPRNAAALAARLTTPVIASGGVASLDDLRRLMEKSASGIAGVICGRALYDGRIAPRAALALLRGEAPGHAEKRAC